MDGIMATTGGKSVSHPGRAAVFVLASFALLVTTALQAEKIEFFDPFEVMDEVRRLEADPLWPGFDPGTIPVGLYDGKRTYLFGFPTIPHGFKPIENRSGVLVFDGPHPAVSRNVRFKLDGVWIAASIPARRSEFTGRAMSLTDIAAIVIHEKFHVFQAVFHPDWKPNDAVLLAYPMDTADSLKARSLEIEALRRAVISSDPGAAAWAKTALTLRRERLSGLDDAVNLYEREIQRLEGIAEYVEYKAAKKPAAADPVPVGFAPKAIREMGYIEGRWIAVLLDRLDPEWKDGVEAGRIAYLEDRLDEVLQDGPHPAAFTADEEALWAADVRTEMAKKDADRQRMRAELKGKLGITVIIEARIRPLRFQMFDPFSLETAGPHALLHSQWVSLKNDRGIVEAIGMQVLTETDEYSRVIRLVVSGLARRPRLPSNQNSLRYQSDGLFVLLRSVRLHPRGLYTYVIELI